MKKIVLIPALAMFVAGPALAQTTPNNPPTPAGTINAEQGRLDSQIEGARESQQGTQMGRDAAAPAAPSQISGSESSKTGATPTDENRDEIRNPVR
jgi:hypothetical protein